MGRFILGEGQKSDRDVVLVNRKLGIAILDDNESLDITNWLGIDGEECEPMEAVVCVSGPSTSKGGMCFYTIDLRQFEGVTVQ